MSLTILSCRDQGISPFDLGVPSYFQNGVCKPIDTAFIKTLPKQLNFLISGYNMPGRKAEDSYAVIAQGLEQSGFVGQDWIGFTWPTGIGLSWIVPHWTKIFSHNEDRSEAMERATNSGQFLRTVLQVMKEEGITINMVQTHSLGARVACTALSYGDIHVKKLVLSAPAVDDDCFEVGKEFDHVPDFCDTVDVACSTGDDVLKDMYHFANVGFDNALGLEGPANYLKISFNVRSTDFSGLVHEHSGYRDVPQYYHFLRDVDMNLIKDRRTKVLPVGPPNQYFAFQS